MDRLLIKDWTELDYMFKTGGLRAGVDPRTYTKPVLDKDGKAEIKFLGKEKAYASLNDALSVPNAPLLFPKVINNIVREAIEPLLVGTSLLTRINYTYGQTITFGATGAMEAADIPEGGEYPEQSLPMGGSVVTATIGKSGIAVKVTDEMIRYSQFDVIGMHLRAAGKALARLKEEKIFNMIRNQGATLFDNATPASSLYGVTTGRDLTGAANGSITMDDIFDGWAQILANGFMPDTLLVHPLTWAAFVKDPHLRMFALNSGGGTFFATWNGSPQGGNPAWDAASQGGLGASPGQNVTPGQTSTGATAPHGLTATSALDQSQVQTGQFQLPQHAGFMTGFRIVVSPYVPFDPTKRLTDIYLFQSGELGFHIVDEEPSVEEFDDPARDLRKMKIRERYALAMNNEGHAVGVFRNVKVVPNEVVLPAQAHLDVASSNLGIIPAGTAVV